MADGQNSNQYGLSDQDVSDLRNLRSKMGADDPRRAKIDQMIGPEVTVQAAPAEWSLPWATGKVMTLRDWLVNQLPTAGGIVGEAIGAGAGAPTGPGALGTAALGSAAGAGLGEIGRQTLTEHFHPEDVRMAPTEAAKGIGVQAGGQGLATLLTGGLARKLAPSSEKTINKLFSAADLGPSGEMAHTLVSDYMPKNDLESVLPEIMASEGKTPADTIGKFIGVLRRAKQPIADEVDTAMKTPVPVKTTSTMFGTNEPAQISLSMKDGTPFTLKRQFSGKYEAFTPDNRKIGDFSFVRHANGEWVMSGANVIPEFQKKGVATAAYNGLEDVTGSKFTPSGSQSGAGQKFWERRMAGPQHIPQPATNAVPLGSIPASGQPIADQIRMLKNNHPSDLRWNPQKLAAIENRALAYEKNPETFANLNDRRIVLNDELNRFYALGKDKTGAAQAQYLAAHPEFEIDKAEADAIRDVIYPAMDKAAGKPPGYFENLQRKRGALSSIEAQAIEQANNLHAQSLRNKGELPTVPVKGYGTSSGHVGLTTRLFDILHRPDVEAQANKKVAQAFGRTWKGGVARALSTPIGREVMGLPLRELTPVPMPQPAPEQ